MTSTDNESTSLQPTQSLYRKPTAVLIVQIVLFFCAFGAIGAAAEISQVLKSSRIIGFSGQIISLIYLSFGLFAVFLIVALNRRKKHARWLTVSYLFSAVLFFPILFVYGVDAGVFTPPELLPRDQLGGSALLEKVRLVLLPFVAVLFAFNTDTKIFLSSGNLPAVDVENNTN